MQFLKAFDASMGNITVACKKVGISRQTFYNWINKNAEFKEAIEEIEEAKIDAVETMLMKQISKGNLGAIIFFLKTKGKKRGYVEKMQIDHYEKEKNEKKFVFEVVEAKKIDKKEE